MNSGRDKFRFDDPARSGVFRFPAAERKTIVEAAHRSGLAPVTIDLAELTDKIGVLSALAAALRFPEWFGANWDALDDCLTDLSWLHAGAYLLLLDHADPLRRINPEVFEQLLQILADASAAWRAQKIAMWVLVDTDDSGLDALSARA